MTKNSNIGNILKQVSITIREVFQFSYNLYNNNGLHNHQNSYNQIMGKIKHYNLLKNTTDIFNHISRTVIIGIRRTTFETKKSTDNCEKQIKADQQTRPKLIPFCRGKSNPSKSSTVHVSQPRYRNPLISPVTALKWSCKNLTKKI